MSSEGNRDPIEPAQNVRCCEDSSRLLEDQERELITGAHCIPTLAIILPIVSSWHSLMSPMRLVRNKFRLYFLCSQTHSIAPCGSEEEGYSITVTKQWVQDAAPVLREGLELVKLAAVSGRLPLPDLLGPSVRHATMLLDAALRLVQDPKDDDGDAVVEIHYYGEGASCVNQNTDKAYRVIQEVLMRDGINIALTSGLRQVTHNGKTAWIMDSDEVEAQFRAS